MKSKYTISAIIILILSIIITFISVYEKPKHSGVKWTENKTTIEYDISYIAIPGFSELHFEKDTTTQTINFYNPEENNCIMDISIEMDDNTIIWSDSSLMPGYGFKEIELFKPLKQGVYRHCFLCIYCKSIDGKTELNGGNLEITIYVD